MKKTACLIILTIILSFSWKVMSIAQGADADKIDVQVAQGGMVLSIEDVSRLALENNFDIQLAKYDAWIARTDKKIAESIYDTVLNAEARYNNDQFKKATTILGTKIIDNDYSLQVNKKLPTGTTLGLSNANNRNWTNSPFATLNPSHDSAVQISVLQELGRNFFGIQDRGAVKITLIDIQNSEYTSLEKIEADLSDAQKAYWDLVAQHEIVKNFENMVEEADKLLSLNREKITHGVIEQPELLASEVNYKDRVNDLLLARNTLDAKSNILRLFLNIANMDAEIFPADQLSLDKKEQQLENSLKAAFDNRYDYKESMNTIKSKNINLAMRKAGLWPEINLEASFARNGVDQHFRQAYEQISEEDNPELFAGLSITFPLENNEAEGEKKAAELEKAQALIALKKVERFIVVGIHDRVRDCNIYYETAQNAQEIAELQANKLQAELKRYQQGRSDTDTIIRYQRELNLAQIQSIVAKYRYYAALIDLKREEGTLLITYWDGEL